MSISFNVPILLVVFNRADTAKKVIQAIKTIKPPKLYIAADGPRAHKEGEDKLCQETRDAVLGEIDWDCEVLTLFREKNVGCRLGVSGAINWLFENEDRGIILEDDCLPHESFFSFCSELLEFYKDDERIMHISGFNEQDGIRRGDASYYFSNYPSIWGWATWKRAWKLYQLEVKKVDGTLKEKIISTAFYSYKRAGNRWFSDFSRASVARSSWGYQWPFCVWKNYALAITPNEPLVKNIGFDGRGTHTTGTNKEFMSMELRSIDEKIKHPSHFIPDKDADFLTYRKHLVPELQKRIPLKTKYLLKKLWKAISKN